MSSKIYKKELLNIVMCGATLTYCFANSYQWWPLRHHCPGTFQENRNRYEKWII